MTELARPSAMSAWFLASRPKTLVAGFVPVAVGSALALRDHAFSWSVALAALAGALCIQIGTNLANDAFDFKSGADTKDRLGPARATVNGWLTPRQVLRGAFVCFAAAALIGSYLVIAGGWPILAIGVCSIAAGYAYTGGPFPLGYNGLGDVFVFVFFGLVAVGGTYFVQAHTVTPAVFAAAVPVGLLGVALLSVNNVRDAQTDAAAGKRTLIVRFGTRFGRAEWFVCVALSAVVPVVMWATGLASVWALVALVALPLAVGPAGLVARATGGELNRALAGTARLQLVFCGLFAAGLAQ